MTAIGVRCRAVGCDVISMTATGVRCRAGEEWGFRGPGAMRGSVVRWGWVGLVGHHEFSC